MEEASEMVHRIENGGKLPITPHVVLHGWVYSKLSGYA